MSKILKVLVFAVFTLCLSFSIMAQTSTTGAVEGTVTDQNGAVVPGATVTLSGGNLIRPQSVTANEDGVYRFQNVPPGLYTLTVTSTGFGESKQEGVSVSLSKTSTTNVSLTAGGGQVVVDVVGGAGKEIDQTDNTTGTSVSTEQFSSFPTQRTVQSLYTIAPTVTRSGLRDASGRDRDPSVAGSSGPENNYILDGVNTTDPAFGGGGANLPFEFVQEVEVKTGSYGAEYGLATGGIFNVITKQGTNEWRGEVYGYFTTKSFVRDTKNLPFTGLAPNGFSEIDAGVGIGGPIIKDKLAFYGSFNPQRRTNNFLTQTFRQEVEGKITTPFYAGKLTWNVNNSNIFTVSTFGDFTKEEGHLFAGSGFGNDLNSFRGVRETGGTNYAFRLNSTFNQNFIAEFSFGMHFQRSNTIPEQSVAQTALVTDNFAVLRANGTINPVTQTGTLASSTNVGFVDYSYSPGGSLQRGFVQQGFGLFTDQTRDRFEFAARLQNIWGRQTFKYGFEFYRNLYDINTVSSGPTNTFANPLAVPSSTLTTGDNSVSGFRVTNNFSVCAVIGTVITCPSGTAVAILASPGVVLPAGLTLNPAATPITTAQALNSPFLVRTSTRVRDFQLIAQTRTDVQSFYVQDDIKLTNTIQINIGVRWDFQQAFGNENEKYLTLNSFKDNIQPRIGFVWDFTGTGKGKFFANFARYIETPIPLDLNVRAGSNNSQTDKNFNVNRYSAPLNSTIATGFSTRNLGSHPTPIDQGLKPQSVNEWTAGFEYEVKKDLVIGFRGIYRAQDQVIEDGSFDDGDNYFIFNPGDIRPGDNTTEELACNNPAIGCFGPARRYYRALEFTATRRFNNNFAFIASYVFSSLTGNYEGLFRNDNGQSDPNITSLFDLVSLLKNSYGRLPNDRPHQFKFNGTYRTPFKLVISGNFYAQSGQPFNALIPHPVYGNNEGFLNPRGTTIVPDVEATGIVNGNGGISSAIGSSRSPTTFNLDLGFYYPIAFGEKRELRFTADWFNVFNSQRAVKLDETFTINSGVTGVPPVVNPFFGTGTNFQYPTSLRLGAKFRF